MESACCWAVLRPWAGSSPVLVIFSISVSRALTACSHVGNDGGALAVSSCLPKTASFLSAARVGSCHALFTDGRSVESEYHLAWTLGSASQLTNFHDVSRFFVFLKTTK